MYHDQLNGLLALKVVADSCKSGFLSSVETRAEPIFMPYFGTDLWYRVIVAEHKILASRVSFSMYLFA